MPWRCALMAALLTWLWLAGPAVAGLKSYTDSQGVIHISNVKPRPAPIQADRLAAAPEPSALVSPPQTANPVASTVIQPLKAAAVDLQAATEATQTVCRDLASNQIMPPPQAMDQIIAAAGLAAAARPNKVAAPQLPRHQVAYEATVAGSCLPPAPQPETRKKQQLVTAGGIRRYRDTQGVWHISNVAPEDNAADSMLLAAGKRRGSGCQVWAESPARQAAVASSPSPLRKVAWNPDAPGGSPLSSVVARARTGDPGTTSAIRRYRDHKGVIHISNVVEPTKSVQNSILQARAGPGKAGEPPIRGHPAAPVMDLEAPWALKPAAWSGEALPLRRARTTASRKAEIVTQGGIRRWRDKQGVWHLKTVEYPWPEGLPVPARLAGLIPGVPASGPPAPAAPPRASPETLQPAPATKPPLSTIMAFRDRRGRLQIINKPPPMAHFPPALAGATAPAELGPLIAEAAQVHRLPATLIRAVIKTESNFCSWAVSPKGAMGLMQLMPGTASFLGVQEPFDPRQNILGGCRYLRQLIDLFGGNLTLALAGYNAGFQRVINSGYQVPAIKETQEFVTQVMGRYVTEEKKLGLPWT
jgi:soluble lytic murein transglycosylase-like protein